jgi:AcrR family transcriptional regulator
MAYRVIKTIGARQYEYEVVAQRDPASGKTRNRWTYIGRVAREESVAKERAPRTNARLRLLTATEALLESGQAAAITIDAIAAAAGVAHGTFYRYFRDRSDVLEALARHLRETGPGVDDLLLGDEIDSLDAARAGLRAWLVEKLRWYRERRATLRAWIALTASDARLAAYREERRESTLRRLRELRHPAATAVAVMALVEGIMRASLLEHDQLDDDEISAAADVVERAVFAQLPPRADAR